MQFSNDQENAIKATRYWYKNSLSFGFFLAGPAGSGKTSIARALAEIMQNPQFCAYTGRAALQLTKKGCPAKTLHQLFYNVQGGDDGEVTFLPREWNEDHPLWKCDCLIIDEASFVDGTCAELILRTGKPYLLLGDPFQLPPPTGGGALIANQKPDYLLTEIHRQAQDNLVLRLATQIRNGGGLSSKFVVRAHKPAEAAVKLLEDLKRKAPAGASHMLLAGKNATVRGINVKSREKREAFLEPGEPLLCLKNDHKKGLMNGSIWTSQTRLEEELLEHDEAAQILYSAEVALTSTDFADLHLPRVRIDYLAMLGMDKDSGWKAKGGTPFDYGYGRTVHKAQGDEAYSGVVIDESRVFGEHRARWLYTAVSRFTDDVLIVVEK
jgi:exodeoxyribonuclease-5